MLLNQTAEYAFRAMAYLCTAPEGMVVRARDLSEGANIPAHYVSKVMRHLVVHGLVVSQRGHGGGFQLARPPEEIRFLDVLEATEFNPGTRHCAFGLGECNPRKPCALHSAWSVLNHTFMDWAQKTTLKQVMPGARLPELETVPPELRDLLRAPDTAQQDPET